MGAGDGAGAGFPEEPGRAGAVPVPAVPARLRSAPPCPAPPRQTQPGAARPGCGTRRRPWGPGNGTAAGAPGAVSGAGTGDGGTRGAPRQDGGHGVGGPGAWGGPRLLYLSPA